MGRPLLTIVYQDIVKNRDCEWNEVLVFEAADDGYERGTLDHARSVLVRVRARVAHQAQGMNMQGRPQTVDLEHFAEEL